MFTEKDCMIIMWIITLKLKNLKKSYQTQVNTVVT